MWLTKLKATLVSVLVIAGMHASYDCASKGRVTEALFIVQNKQEELVRYIQSLKKKLTDCSVREKNREYKKEELDICRLYQKYLPSNIHELEALARSMTTYIDQFSQDECIKEISLKEAVEKAFLIKEKCKLESSILLVLEELERIDWNSQGKQKGLRSRAYLRRLKKDHSYNKRLLANRKMRLAKMNDRLYPVKVKDQKTLLDQLD